MFQNLKSVIHLYENYFEKMYLKNMRFFTSIFLQSNYYWSI